MSNSDVIVKVVVLANLSPDSGNLTNFESVLLQIFWFGDLADLWRFFENFGSKFFGLSKYTNASFFVRYSLKMCSSVILYTPCIFARFCLHIHMYGYYFKLADGLKIRDIK